MSTTPADVVRRVLEAVDVTARLRTARVAFTVEHVVEKSEPVRGEPCDRLAVRADLVAAAEACADPIAAPALPRYADLRRLPVSCWIDAGSLVRRVRVDLARLSTTVDLVEFGV